MTQELNLLFDQWVEEQNRKNFKLAETPVFVEGISHKYSVIALSTLYQKRAFKQALGPYNPDRMQVTKTAKRQVSPDELWTTNVDYTTEFKDQSFETLMPGTEKLTGCYHCHSTGSASCKIVRVLEN